MKGINRRLLFNLVDVVWGESREDESVPSTDWARRMIKKAIERTRKEKYSKKTLNG
jgi:hypothetical protein